MKTIENHASPPPVLLALCLAAALTPFALSAAAAKDFRSIDVGPTPECVIQGFDGSLAVSLMGSSRVKGDGDGSIVLVKEGAVTTLATGFDDPKGMAMVGDVIVVTDFDTVWTVDAKGAKKILAAAGDFPSPALYLNDVAGEMGRRSVLVTEMGKPGAMSDPSGAFWPLDSDEAKNIPLLGRVYRVTLDGKVSVVIDHAPEIPNPNGVLQGSAGVIWVADFFRGNLLEWKAGNWRTVSSDHRSIDGIARDRAGNLYVTEVRTGRVWKIDGKTGEKMLLATLTSAADLLLDESNKQLIVPDSKAGRIVFIPYSS